MLLRSHVGKKTSWFDPRLDGSTRKKLEDCEDDGACAKSMRCVAC